VYVSGGLEPREDRGPLVGLLVRKAVYEQRVERMDEVLKG